MTADEHLAGWRLLETGTLVPFRVVQEEMIAGPDQAEFAVRIELVMDGEEEEDAADVAGWGALGFMFVLGVLSFDDARPRGASEPEYEERDAFRVSDFLEGLRFERGELVYYGDYVRGRRMKTHITVRPDGTAKVETQGRGKALVRWLARLQGKQPLEVVRGSEGDA